ncbi:hypothetical protein BFC22_05240 [Carnobacterium divergens]|nr:hypothetical protein BFC22_05240 [Carnobacterium divergens]
MSKFYRTASYVMIVLFGIFSGFVGKSNITTYDALRSAKAMLFLVIILTLVSLPELISIYIKKRNEDVEK